MDDEENNEEITPPQVEEENLVAIAMEEAAHTAYTEALPLIVFPSTEPSPVSGVAQATTNDSSSNFDVSYESF